MESRCDCPRQSIDFDSLRGAPPCNVPNTIRADKTEPPPDMSFRGSESESRNLPKLRILSCVGFFSNVVDSSTPLRCGRNDMLFSLYVTNSNAPRFRPPGPDGDESSPLHCAMPFIHTGSSRNVPIETGSSPLLRQKQKNTTLWGGCLRGGLRDSTAALPQAKRMVATSFRTGGRKMPLASCI